MRHYRVVKLLDHGRDRWCVVSSSMRDDDTWDVIAEFTGRQACFRYIDDVYERNKAVENASRNPHRNHKAFPLSVHNVAIG